ncbi:MAG: tyrosine-type recombinase/integrase [Candidatus Acidiferrum sp.]
MLIKDLATTWLQYLETRKRKPVKPASLQTYGCYVRLWIIPIIGDAEIETFQSRQMKEFVEALVIKKLSAKTIHEVVSATKAIIRHAVDDNGEQLFQRNWNSRFIDAPNVTNQKGSMVRPEQLEAALHDPKYRVLYAFLAGTGLRIGEAAAVRIGSTDGHSCWDPAGSVVHIRTSMWNRQEQLPKTKAAVRSVDLDPRLNELLKKYVGQRTGFLFVNKAGGSIHVNGVRERSLKGLGIEGFHSFRRFRITRLRELGTPEDIIRFWVGHAGASITDRYSKLADMKDLRKQWAQRSGLGFELPDLTGDTPPMKKSKPSATPKARKKSFAADPRSVRAAVASEERRKSALDIEWQEKFNAEEVNQ